MRSLLTRTLLVIWLAAVALILFRWWQSQHIHALPFSIETSSVYIAFWNTAGTEYVQVSTGWPASIPPGKRNTFVSGYDGSPSGFQHALGPLRYWEQPKVAGGWDPVLNVPLAAGPPVRFHSLEAPHWLLLSVALLPAAGTGLVLLVRRATASSRRQKRLALGRCPHCSYDLRAHKPGDKCPECGTPIGQN